MRCGDTLSECVATARLSPCVGLYVRRAATGPDAVEIRRFVIPRCSLSRIIWPNEQFHEGELPIVGFVLTGHSELILADRWHHHLRLADRKASEPFADRRHLQFDQLNLQLKSIMNVNIREHNHHHL